MKRAQWIAFDQHGQDYRITEPTRFPRKALLDMLGRKHANKMYIDRNGESCHIGWVIGGLWLRVYEVVPMEFS